MGCHLKPKKSKLVQSRTITYLMYLFDVEYPDSHNEQGMEENLGN